jgi:hypothetical protein
MEIAKGTRREWNTLAHFRTTDRDRVALLETIDKAAVMWSYQDHSPQFIEYPTLQAAQDVFAKLTLTAIKDGRMAPAQEGSLSEHEGGADIIVRLVADLRRAMHDRGWIADRYTDGLLACLEDQARDLYLVVNDQA